MTAEGIRPLIDPFNRRITYLRISVTDRCNLRCRYCMPDIHIRFLPREKILTFEEIETIVRVMARLGVKSLRLTGGEPTVRAGIVELVARLKAIPGIEEIAMTTNGMLLSRLAGPLKAAGLDRINISLDTLKPERFKFITQFGDFDAVWDGILAAEAAGLEPIKLNAVVMRGVNDDEVEELAALTLEHPWHVRFIEWMPFGEDGAEVYRIDGIENAFMPLTQVKARLEEAFGPLEPAEVQGNGPAKSFKIRGAKATVGFIRPITEEHFCARCNKVRLTADGKLRLCLLTDHEIDLLGPLRGGLDEAGLEALLRAAIQTKPERHLVNEGIIPNLRRMIQIGG